MGDTMVIKKVNGGVPVAGPSEVKTPRVSGSGFGDVAAARTTGARAAQPGEALVLQAVSDVARNVHAGGLTDADARVDAVIARVVELRLGEGVDPAVVRAGIDDAQTALGGHPTFSAHVTDLLDKALADLG